MKRIFYLLAIVTIGFSSCSTSDSETINTPATTITKVDPVQLAADDATIKTYLTTNKLTATKDTSGLYYQIVTQGTGLNPKLTSIITVSYTGSLLVGGTVFDQATNVTFPALNQLIQGWQIGLPFLKAGGNIILYVPSGLAYGANANTTATATIPANSILIFNINLVSVQNSL